MSVSVSELSAEDFLSSIRSCTLSNDQIAKTLGVSVDKVLSWRQSRSGPHPSKRLSIIRELSIVETDLLVRQLDNFNNKER